MVLEEKKLEILQKILDESTYTVALCGSGIVTECGQRTLKSPEMAYDVEEKYGVSPEEILRNPASVTETADEMRRL